ncbi:MAG: methyltransferase domain-containing protein [Solirubrobacteraceae bacterium]
MKRVCPVCGARRGRRVWSEAGYAYLRCSCCGAIFSDLTEADYERSRHNVWNEARPSEGAVEFYGPARERVHDEFLDRWPPFGNGRLLDVGCGLGYFLGRAAERGWSVDGIDTSPAWVELANRRLGSPRVELAPLEQSSFVPGSFALITVWDVVEHVFEPVPFLARVGELLAPGGRLFIRTPNIAYVYPIYAARRLLLGHDVGLGPTNHVVYFTAATMRLALGRAGLQAISWPVHVPPQVAPRPGGAADDLGRQRLVIRAKNAYSRVAGSLARRTGGRVVLGSDLDVVCERDESGSSAGEDRPGRRGEDQQVEP